MTSISRPNLRPVKPGRDRPEPTISSQKLGLPSLNTNGNHTRATNMKDLPLEMIQKIYKSCQDVRSVISLSKTCKQFHFAFEGTQKIAILELAIRRDFDPIEEAIQVVTYNESEPAHQYRDPPMSLALIKQLYTVGSAVNRWCDIWPVLRWREDTSYRRLLRDHELVRLRRAILRYWLYGLAYHSPLFLSLDRGYPLACTTDRRLTFMRRYNEDEILELAEVQSVFEQMVYNDICPTNAMLQRRYLQTAPGHDPLFFGNYETFSMHGHSGDKIRYNVSVYDLPKNLAREAWGNYEHQAGTVADIMKLSPDHLLHLRELGCKKERVEYLETLKEDFHEHPSTFRDALEAVMAERDFMLSFKIYPDGGGIVDVVEDESGEESEEE